MVDKELIEIWRNELKPAISLWLLNTNYKEMGEQDKEEFERDFDEILDLALIGLKHKAQLSQEGTTKDTTSDTISRQAAIDAIHGRIFQEIVVEYPSYNTYTEYKGKPYFSIKYTENGQEFIGYGTYKPEVLSEYLKEYFMPSVQPEQKKDEWISCKKKPPEDFEWVYTQTIYGEHIVTRYVPPKIKPESHPHGYWGDTDCFEYDYFDVVAWRHLPEPYRGEQDDRS